MRAQGRDYRGGFTRDEIRRGEHNLQTCRVRGCSARQEGAYCPEHRDDGSSSSSSGSSWSDAELAGALEKQHNVKQLRQLASSSGVKRKRGDSKRQTAWRIVKQNRSAAEDAV